MEKLDYTYQEYLDLCEQENWRTDLYIPNLFINWAKEYSVKMYRIERLIKSNVIARYSLMDHVPRLTQEWRTLNEKRIDCMLLAIDATWVIYQMDGGLKFDSLSRGQDMKEANALLKAPEAVRKRHLRKIAESRLRA